MMVARIRVRVASCCDVLVVVALCGAAQAAALANAQFLVASTLDLPRHLA
jgi:hypothetical protein